MIPCTPKAGYAVAAAGMRRTQEAAYPTPVLQALHACSMDREWFWGANPRRSFAVAGVGMALRNCFGGIYWLTGNRALSKVCESGATGGRFDAASHRDS